MDRSVGRSIEKQDLPTATCDSIEAIQSTHTNQTTPPFTPPSFHQVKFYADGGASFTKAAGLEFSTGDFGGVRMQRMSALVSGGPLRVLCFVCCVCGCGCV
jgi:peroxiredoxin